MKHDGWEHAKLGSVISRLDSGVSVNGEDRPARDGEPGVLKVSAVSGGYFIPSENKAIFHEERSKAILSPRNGDILISRSNTLDLVGACGYVEGDHPDLYLPDKLWRVVFRDAGRDHPRWLLHVLNSPSVRAALKARATGTSGSMKNISKPAFLNIGINRPPFDEQVYMADMLDCWTTAENFFQQLVVLKQRAKRSLGRQLLTGRQRFSEFTQESWHDVRLQQVTSECVERNRNGLGNLSVMAVTKAEGIVPMRERLIGSDRDRYKVVQRDWFAYNPMRINIGSIARWSGDQVVVVSPDYVVFKCQTSAENGPSLDPDYLDQLRRSEFWEQFVKAAGNGSVRVRIYYEDLARMRIRLPGLAEQRRIVGVLTAADREIDLLRQQHTALKQQKKGLMQKLLTGEVRVRA